MQELTMRAFVVVICVLLFEAELVISREQLSVHGQQNVLLHEAGQDFAWIQRFSGI